MSRVPPISRLGQWRFALLAAAMVLVAAAVIAASVLPAGDGQTAGYAAEEDPSDAPPASLVVAPDNPVLSADAPDVRFWVLLKNPSDTPIDAGTVILSIDNQRAETVGDLQRPNERTALELTRIHLSETPAGEDQLLEVVVLRDNVPLLFSRLSGVYPVHAEFVPSSRTADTVNPETPLGASTTLIWNGVDAASPLSLTLVVPLVLPNGVRTLPSRAELTQYSTRLLQVFDAAEQHNATIAIDPRIIAGIRSLGTGASGNSIELLSRIERSSAPIFLLQFADADPAVQAALGFEELMQPIGLSYATQLGTFLAPSFGAPAPAERDTAAVESDPPLVSDPSGDATDAEGKFPPVDVPPSDPVPDIPTLAELLTLENSRPGAWPVGGEVDGQTLSLLKNAGLTSVVLDSTNVSAATSPRVTLGDFDALIADEATGAAARTAMAGETAAEQAAGTADLTARLALGAQNNAAGAVLALDRGALAGVSDPLQIFRTIDSIDWVQPSSERQLPAGTAVLRAGAPTEERLELLRATLLRSPRVDEVALLLDQPEHLIEYQRERVLEAFATRYAEPGVDFAAVNAAERKRDEELLRGVEPIITQSTQLVGTLSNVPVTLENHLPFEAVVTLRADPISAGIALTNRKFEVRVPAIGNTTVLVPVHSRISSGASGLALEVHDRSGEHTFATAILPLTLRTTIETILMWALGAAATLLLGFGILRSIRRKRDSPVRTDDEVYAAAPSRRE